MKNSDNVQMIVNQHKKGAVYKSVVRNHSLYIMLIPVIAYFIIFAYIPMGGLTIAFENYRVKRGIFGSEWVGWKNFQIMFSGVQFGKVMKNTLSISFLKLLWGFPAPIILALMLNELNNVTYKRVVQTIVYMPHFLSWVIIASVLTTLVSSAGPITQFLNLFGANITQSLLMNKEYFYPILVITGIWKGVGWGTLIYLAAIAGINMELYEAAVVDGANRWQQTLHITIPSLAGTIVVMFILRTGSILNSGFEDILLLQNSLTEPVSETLDTYVYKLGINNGKYSLSTAFGLFKSVVNCAMVLFTNALARRLGESSLL